MSERTDEEAHATQHKESDVENDVMHRVPAEDRVAERFLELEADLSDGQETALPDGTIRRGQIVDATRLPADEVPEAYPGVVGSGEILQVTVDVVDGSEAEIYLNWPEDGEPAAESTLGRLLATLGVAPEELAALYGQRVLVEVVDGYDTLYLPDEQPRGTPSRTGIVASLGGSLVALLGSLLTGGTLAALLFVIFFFTTVVAVPYYTYRDTWYLRTHSDWDGGPLFWTMLAMVPVCNALSTALYLAERRDVTHFVE